MRTTPVRRLLAQDGIVKAGAARARAMAASKGETASPGDNTVSAFHLMYHVNFWAVWILVVWFAVDAVVADNSELVSPNHAVAIPVYRAF